MNWLENIVDKDFLQDNLTFVSMYIAIYEHMTDYVESNIKYFLCNIGIRDGKEFCDETDTYKRNIKNRIVDDKGNKNKTKASFLWLVDNGALSQTDYDKFLEIKEVRNKYAHELTTVILEGVSKCEIELFFDMYALYQKISKWFFAEIEAPTAGIDLQGIDLDGVQNAANMAFGIIINILYNGKSEEYKAMVIAAKEGGPAKFRVNDKE